jgi:fructokinase
MGITPAGVADALGDAETAQRVFAFANRVGAITTTRRGAIPAIPTLDEVQAEE